MFKFWGKKIIIIICPKYVLIWTGPMHKYQNLMSWLITISFALYNIGTEALEGHFYLLLTTYYLSLITYYLLLTTYHLLLTTYYLSYHLSPL